jgi:hypothetical protein
MLGHVDVLTTAKKYIEGLKEGYDVIGAYMSPCSPRYAAKKLKDETVDLKHRLAMARLAVSCHDWGKICSITDHLIDTFAQYMLMIMRVPCRVNIGSFGSCCTIFTVDCWSHSTSTCNQRNSRYFIS